MSAGCTRYWSNRKTERRAPE